MAFARAALAWGVPRGDATTRTEIVIATAVRREKKGERVKAIRPT